MALSRQLEELGSALKSQIMSDLNSWEDRRRGEAPVGRGKKAINKRARPAPLPEIGRSTLVEVRQVRHALLTEDGDVAREVSSWAIGVLAVFVSVADMRGNCNLADLIGLPGAKAVFQLLVLAVESCFGRAGMEEAESALIAATLTTTKDPRVVEWILNQYGATHSACFPRCLHLCAISRLAQGSDAAGGAGLAGAIDTLAATHPRENARALASILDTYRDAVSCRAGVADDDPRRFILSYMLRSQQSALLGSGSRQWLGEAIRREMREGFSRLLVYQDGALTPQPLAAAIDVLFGEQGPRKRASDRRLDIGRVLDVFALIGAVIGARHEPPRSSNDDDSDVQMQAADTDTSDGECLAFVDACRDALAQRIAHEQEVVVLGQLPKTVKNMPQPIPHGLHETVVRGVRIFNNGPVAQPAIEPADVEATCKALFAVLSETSGAAPGDAPAGRLHAMVCDAAPQLVEILAARMDSPQLLSSLVRCLMDGWPMCTGPGGVPDTQAALAFYRSLLAVSECSRGLLLHAYGAIMDNDNADPAAVHHAVSMLAMAVNHQSATATDPALHGVAEVVGGLCGALGAHWPALWTRCFRVSLDAGDAALGPGATWAMRAALVQALARSLAVCPPMQMAAQVALAKRALDELAAVQAAMTRHCSVPCAPADADGLLVLARALLALTCHLAARAGIGRVATERILQDVLRRQSETDAVATTTTNMLRGETAAANSDGVAPCSMQRLAKLLDGRLISTASGGQLPDAMATADRLLWQNAMRPVPRYPRGDMRNHDRTDDAWALARPKRAAGVAAQGEDGRAQGQSLLVLALLAVVQTGGAGGMAVLGQLLEEYYIDAIPSMPLLLLDERLERGRLQLLPVELELLQDVRRNPDLELLLVEMLHDPAHGAPAAKRLVGALVIALVVVWNGALDEPTTNRPADLALTTRLVAHIIDAYAPHDPNARGVCAMLPIIRGRDLARILHQYVWRCLIYRIPGAEDHARLLLRHILRRHITHAAPLFHAVYPHPR
ncbi:hypothetical protein H4R19_002776 [Coemansia spiralis]|nr:hypothetical protein H4R19_002776 [Coemansia spiralis]